MDVYIFQISRSKYGRIGEHIDTFISSQELAQEYFKQYVDECFKEQSKGDIRIIDSRGTVIQYEKDNMIVSAKIFKFGKPILEDIDSIKKFISNEQLHNR